MRIAGSTSSLVRPAWVAAQSPATHARREALDTFEAPDARVASVARRAGPETTGTWPRPADTILGPTSLARLRSGESGGDMLPYVSVDGAEINGKAYSKAISFTLSAGNDVAVLMMGLDDAGKNIVDAEVFPPEAKARALQKLIATGHIKGSALEDFGVDRRLLEGDGQLRDKDGDGKIGAADFDGVVPASSDKIAKTLVADVVAQKSHLLLLGENHDAQPLDVNARVVAQLRQQGKPVVATYELPEELYGDVVERLNQGPMSARERATWRSDFLQRMADQAEATHGTRPALADLEALVGPMADLMLKNQGLGAKSYAIDDFTVKNRDKAMADNLRALSAQHPDAVIVSQLGRTHINEVGTEHADVEMALNHQTDTKNTVARRLQDLPGGVVSAGFVPFASSDDAHGHAGYDRLFAMGAW